MRNTLLPPKHAEGGRSRKFWLNQTGVTAIEFAILAPLFFAVLLALMETSVVFLASQFLDSAVDRTSRLIMTRQTARVDTHAKYKAIICDNLYGLFNCDNLKIRVTEISSFVSAPVSKPTIKNGELEVIENYNIGKPKSIVRVEAYYLWPVLFDFGGFNLENAADGKRLMAAVRVFSNEP